MTAPVPTSPGPLADLVVIEMGAQQEVAASFG